ncbi:tail fiber domain-containing protein [Spirosoma sp. BT702]|uniref:Tail fiber domain-containing protein n=1 Tax=Spirosoma profusum TaxID=2771354 RepID=A0A927AUY1_9BACT|nr:tail fiber domain-containing protein [Spirosoma profusum]MBD2704882.1 tail fiber domain-containing protein [Spirosoma profusum]
MKPLFSLLFWLLLASVGSAQNLYLNQTGDVGIGTRNPLSPLHVKTPGENAMRVEGVNPYVLFRDVNDPTPTDISRSYGYIRTWTSNPFNPAGHYGLEIGVPPTGNNQFPKHLIFATNYATRMTILNNGNVGIGTSSPAYKLDVAGDVRITGNNRVEGFTNIVGTTLFEGSAFDGIVGIRGSAVNALVNIINTADESTGAAISVRSQDNYGTIRATNTRPSFYAGPAILAKTIYGRYSGHFQGGRILVEGGSDASRSGGIEFANLESFRVPNPQAYVGMRDDNELGIYGFPLGDWLLRLNVNSGSICSRSAIALCSDQRLKRDFQPLTGSLTKLTGIQGQHYFWKEAKMPGLQTGFVAQEVQPIFPELVRTDDNGFLSVDYTGFVPHLVEAVKTLKAKDDELVETLRRENEVLQAQLDAVLKRITALETQLSANQLAEAGKK